MHPFLIYNNFNFFKLYVHTSLYLIQESQRMRKEKLQGFRKKIVKLKIHGSFQAKFIMLDFNAYKSTKRSTMQHIQ